MAISKQVQDALDRIHQTQSLVQSVKQASDLQGQQISTLTQKVTDLQAKVDGGGQIGADDLAALSEITSDIDTVNAQLQSAIPANTQGGGAQAGGAVLGGGQPQLAASAASQAQPQPNAPSDPQQAPQGDQSSGAQGSDGDGPKPLAGTGQS